MSSLDSVSGCFGLISLSSDSTEHSVKETFAMHSSLMCSSASAVIRKEKEKHA